jgi:hypothetical protein
LTFKTVHVHITQGDEDDTPAAGRVTLTGPHVLRDAIGNVIHGRPTATVDLVDGQGTLTLPASDDPDIEPTGWAYTAVVATDAWRQEFLVEVPHATVGTVEFADLVRPVTPTAITTYALVAHGHTTAQVTGLDDALDDIGERVDALELGSGGGGVPTTRAVTASTGLTGGGTLASDVVVALSAGSITSLAKADTAVQPATLDTRLATLLGAAPAALDTLVELATALGNDANFAGTVTTALAARATTAELAAQRHRIVRVRDVSLTSPAFYSVPDTTSAWALFAAPGEYSIAAAIGDDIEVHYSVLAQSATTWFLDMAVVTGATPTLQRYLVSGSGASTFEGNPADYANGSGASFQGRSGTLGFTVASGDLDGGLVRLRWAVKSTGVNGRLYASANYPLLVSIRNSRASA